jgi:hypothetical protein
MARIGNGAHRVLPLTDSARRNADRGS